MLKEVYARMLWLILRLKSSRGTGGHLENNYDK